MELDRPGAELLFQVLTEREEEASGAIASNEAFSGWTKTFTNPRLCAAIVDRLTSDGGPGWLIDMLALTRRRLQGGTQLTHIDHDETPARPPE